MATFKPCAPWSGRSSGPGACATTQSRRPPSVRLAMSAVPTLQISVSKAASREAPSTRFDLGSARASDSAATSTSTYGSPGSPSRRINWPFIGRNALRQHVNAQGGGGQPPDEKLSSGPHVRSRQAAISTTRSGRRPLGDHLVAPWAFIWSQRAETCRDACELRAQSRPSAWKETSPLLPTITWSWTTTSIAWHAAMTRAVISMSCWLGVGSPEG